MRDGRIDVQRLTGDALLFFRRQKAQGAHVVQAVGQLHQHHANIGDHGQQHLAHALYLADFRRDQVQPADLGHAFHQTRRIRTESGRDCRERNPGILHHVVQQSGAERGDVQPQVRQDMSHFQGMGEVRFARFAQLRLVLVGGESEGPLEGSKVVPGTVLPHVCQEFGKARL